MTSDASKTGSSENKAPVGNVAELRAGRMNSVGVPAEKSKNFSLTAKRLAQRMGRETWLVLLILLMAVVSVALIVSGPRILGRGTDIIFDGLTQSNGATGVDFGQLHRTLELAIGVYLLSYILAYGQSFLLAGVVQRTMFKMRRDVEGKIHRLPLRYIDKHSRGDLLSRVTNDIDNIAQSLQQSLSQLVLSLLTIIGVVIMMFTVSPVLALIALTVIPLTLLTMSQIAKRSREKFIAQWRYTGQLNGLVEEAFTGHAIVKVFGRQQEVEDRFQKINDELYEAANSAQFMSGAIQPATMFLGNLNYVAIAVVGGLRVASGTMSIGDVQAFVQYSRQFTQPMTQAASMANVLQSGVASAERVFELLDAEEQTPDIGVTDPTPTLGRVEFDQVTFSYDSDKSLITNLSFVAEPGTTVAIVGPTGAGKTTLVNLIMRFYELNSGHILLDGRDIAEMPRHELRSKIGMVLQDTWLFNGSIRENIAYGNPGASEEDIRTAAKATYVDRFVRTLPDGYDTVLTGESGAVSAGEKQLLTIARAFLADPAILILDEATSSVDTRTEVLIQKAMNALRHGRTSFVIAHRLSTIQDADIILVMENGAIVEQGSHVDLLAAQGAYFRLYQSQFSAPAADLG